MSASSYDHVRAEGASAEDVQTRALAVGVKATLPKPILAELPALGSMQSSDRAAASTRAELAP